MKTRILSTVLAVLLVVSMLSIFSSAAESTAKATISIGTTYAKAGTTARVPVYVQATGLSAAEKSLRDIELQCTGAALASITETLTWNSTSKSYATNDMAYVRESENVIGITVGTGKELASKEQVTAEGGFCVSYVAFKVPADATGEIELNATLNTLDFQDKDLNQYKCTDVTINPGKIIVSSFSIADSNSEKTDVCAIPAINQNGERVTEIANAQKIDGTYGTLIIPASIVNATRKGLKDATVTKLVIKNSQYTKIPDGIAAQIENEIEVYYHLRANGASATYESLIAHEKVAESGSTFKNILSAPTVTVNGTDVTAVGIIAVADDDYADITITIDFGQGTVKTITTTAVYKALSNAETADGTYYFGLTVTGVPAGTYNTTVTVTANTADQDGTNVVVISDVTTQTITVG